MSIIADPLSFADLRAVDVERCNTAFGASNTLHDWTVERWALATIGEAGEMCNAVKKLVRGDGSVDDVADEIADIVIYCDLMAARLGIDLGERVRAKFNKTSDKIGSSIKLPPSKHEPEKTKDTL